MRNTIAIGLLVLVLGCSNAPASTCDVPDRNVCLDYITGFSEADATSSCTAQWMGEYSNATLCTGVGRVGRCTITCDSTMQIVYSYAPLTSADAERACEPPAGSTCAYEFDRN